MKIKALLALCAAGALCGCQTSNQADYVQIGYGPSFDVAHAQRELQKRSVDQGTLPSGRQDLLPAPGLATLWATQLPRTIS